MREARSAADYFLYNPLKDSERRLFGQQIIQMPLTERTELLHEVWSIAAILNWSLFESLMSGVYHVRRWTASHRPGDCPRVEDIVFGSTRSGLVHSRLVISYIIIDKALGAIKLAETDPVRRQILRAVLNAWKEIETSYTENDFAIRELGVHFAYGSFEDIQRQLPIATSTALRSADAVATFDCLLEKLML